MRKPDGTPAPKPRTSATKRKRPPVSSSTSFSAKLSSLGSSGLGAYASGSEVDDETEEGGFEADGESPKRAAARASGGATKRRRASVDVGGTVSIIGLDPPRISGSGLLLPRTSASTSNRRPSPRDADMGPTPMIADPRTSSPSRRSPASVPLPAGDADDWMGIGVVGTPMFSADGKPLFADGRPMFVEGKRKKSDERMKGVSSTAVEGGGGGGVGGDADVYTADGRRHSIAF